MSGVDEEQPLLNLNARCGGGRGAPNVWENPGVTGINRLPPHSRNVRDMAEAYASHRQRTVPGNDANGPPPCVCLDSSQLNQVPPSQGSPLNDVQSKGWKFRLFPNPKSIPGSFIAPQPLQQENEPPFCSKDVSIPSNWTMKSHRECCGVHDPPQYTNVSSSCYDTTWFSQYSII